MFKETVDSVLSDLSRKVGQLRDLAEKHNTRSDQYWESVSTFQRLAGKEAQDRDRATRIAEKFEELLK